MRRPLLASVRARTTAVAVVVVASLLVVWGASLVIVVGRSMDSYPSPGRMASELTGPIEAGTLPRVVPLPGGEDDDDDAFAQVVDPSGRVVAASANMVGQPAVRDPSGGAGSTWEATFEGLPPVDVDDQFEVIALPVRSPGGTVTLVVGAEVERVERSVHHLRNALAAGGPVVVLLSAALVWVVVGRSLRPVEAIRQQVAAISSAASGWRVAEPPVDDEIGRLARTMNEMLDRLESSADRQRRFVSDASHELRSPLATCRAQLEIAAAHPAATDYPAMVGELLDENHRMERLVADLSFLARGDEVGFESSRAEVALDEVVLADARRREARGPGCPRKQDHGPVALDATGVGPAPVLGRADHLARVVRNLVDNATRHARSTVRLELRPVGAEVELVVADDGDGVDPRLRERIFDRFTRLDEARSRDAGGAGLGLAIVRDIVSGHGGRLWVEDAPGGGARFVVRLPAAAAVPTRDRDGGPAPAGTDLSPARSRS